VVEIVRRVIAIERTERQLFHFVRQFRVWVTVDDRYLIPLGVEVLFVSSVLRPRVISLIDDAGILHLDRWTEAGNIRAL
jgi:hypothetical protein